MPSFASRPFDRGTAAFVFQARNVMQSLGMATGALHIIDSPSDHESDAGARHVVQGQWRTCRQARANGWLDQLLVCYAAEFWSRATSWAVELTGTTLAVNRPSAAMPSPLGTQAEEDVRQIRASQQTPSTRARLSPC